MDRPRYSHGAERLDDGRVRFRLWAPAANHVTLHLEGVPVAMQALEGGWFEAWESCAAGSRYWFEPAGVGKVPDPASRAQAGGLEGPSVVVDHGAYRWVNQDWIGRPWHETILYEAHVGLLGGFDGVRARLPELARLGVTALELMPIAQFSGTRNWGYDGVLPYAPHHAYGTPDSLKALIDAAHGLGIMVFLDVVYNHFGPVGNYLPSYAPQYFRDDVPTPWGAAIDFRRAPVRAFFAENARYWLREYRFDGLRFDAVHAIVEKEHWLGELAVYLRDAVPRERCVHLVLENDDNTASLLRHGFDAQWNDDIHHVVHHLLTGETRGYYAAYAQRPTEKLARALAQGFIYQGEPSPAHDGRPRGEPSGMLPPTAFVFFLQNHDQVGNRAYGERLAALCSDHPEALAAATALQILCPSIPLIFMGEEQGAKTPFLYFTHYTDLDFAAKVTAGRRAEFAGFHEDGDGAIPDPNAPDTWERSKLSPTNDAGARRWRDFYTTLLQLRREHVIPGLKGCTCESAEALARGCVVAEWSLGNGYQLAICCNLSGVQVDISTTPHGVRGNVFYESEQGAGAAVQAGTMPAYCTVAALRKNESPVSGGSA